MGNAAAVRIGFGVQRNERAMKIKSSQQLWREYNKRQKKLNLSRRSIADMAGISHATWTEIQKRDGRMTLDTALRLADALGLEIVLGERG